MKHFVDIGNQSIAFELKRSHLSKHVRISVRQNGIVTVSAPHRVPDIFIKQLVKEKADWIFDKLKNVSQKPLTDLSIQSRAHYQKYKEAARKIIEQKVDVICKTYGFDCGRIAIKQHKTKWGSCSKKKNSNFNYKLFFVPEPLMDYVVMHELCHTKHLNHSPAFWRLVESIYPKYKIARKQLKHISINT